MVHVALMCSSVCLLTISVLWFVCVGMRVARTAILAVHRFGDRIRQKIGEISLQGGDVLLLATIPTFLQHHRSDHHFALVSIVEDSSSRSRSKLKLLFAVGVTLAMVIGRWTRAYAWLASRPLHQRFRACAFSCLFVMSLAFCVPCGILLGIIPR
jgi:hypothetical protein